MSVEELRAKYEEIVGRQTSSTNRTYLVWRVQQAMKGKIPVGPGRGRGGPAVPHKVVPVRLPEEAVPQIDEAWKRLGIRNRTEFFRRAVHDYLDHAGEKHAASLLAADA